MSTTLHFGVLASSALDLARGEIVTAGNLFDDEYAVGPVAVTLPGAFQRELQRSWGDLLSERDRNLVVAGVSLAVAAMKDWVELGDDREDASDSGSGA